MTRMQKWQKYREEIAYQSKLSEDTAKENALVKKYEDEIAKINPAILTLTKDENVTLERGVTQVDASNKGVSGEIIDMFRTINLPGNIINEDAVKDILFNLQNGTILETNKKSKNSFKKEYFENNDSYIDFKKTTNPLTTSTNNESIKTELENKFNNFSAKAEEKQMNRVTLDDGTTQSSKTSHYVFVISVAVSVLLLAIVLALFIARLVTR